MLKRFIMQNLPSDQRHMLLDTVVNNVFQDLQSVGRGMELKDIFDGFKALNNTQDLVMFSNGTVAATKKGLRSYA